MANRNINQPMPGPGSVNSRRFFPGWGSITFQEPRGNSNYQGLQTKVEKTILAWASLPAVLHVGESHR